MSEASSAAARGGFNTGGAVFRPGREQVIGDIARATIDGSEHRCGSSVKPLTTFDVEAFDCCFTDDGMGDLGATVANDHEVGTHRLAELGCDLRLIEELRNRINRGIRPQHGECRHHIGGHRIECREATTHDIAQRPVDRLDVDGGQSGDLTHEQRITAGGGVHP